MAGDDLRSYARRLHDHSQAYETEPTAAAIAAVEGEATLVLTGAVTAPSVHVTGNITTTGNVIAAVESATASTSPFFDLIKRGAGGGAVADNHWEGGYSFYGDDGTGDIEGARILAQVDGTVATNDMPTELIFSVNAGAAAVTDAVVIKPAGDLISSTADGDLGLTGSRWNKGWFDDLDVGASITVGTPTISSGSGTPETAVTAPIGSLFMRTDGGAATSVYVKESGAGNTGWVAK